MRKVGKVIFLARTAHPVLFGRRGPVHSFILRLICWRPSSSLRTKGFERNVLNRKSSSRRLLLGTVVAVAVAVAVAVVVPVAVAVAVAVEVAVVVAVAVAVAVAVGKEGAAY